MGHVAPGLNLDPGPDTGHQIAMRAAIPFPDLSPELFSLSVFGVEIALRWYALAYIAGILIGWRLAVTALRRPALWPAQTPPMSPRQLEDLLTWVILGVILGGRLGFVFFRLILFPAWLYLFISDMRNHPEQTWDLMNGFERYGYILSKHRRRTPAPPPALRTRLSEHICVSQPVAQPTSCCSRCR